jgi:hypothetical protein
MRPNGRLRLSELTGRLSVANKAVENSKLMRGERFSNFDWLDTTHPKGIRRAVRIMNGYFLEDLS